MDVLVSACGAPGWCAAAAPTTPGGLPAPAASCWGGGAYVDQLRHGLIVTNMRDQVSWGFYIGNFTFLVGVAAAAIMLVIPAYVYHWKPIKEIVILGELLAISAIIMCLLFVTVDMGQPDRALAHDPGRWAAELPELALGWDVMVLNVYLVLNIVIVVYLLYSAFHGRPSTTASSGRWSSSRSRPRSASTRSPRSSTTAWSPGRTGTPRSSPRGSSPPPSAPGRRCC